MPLAGLLCKYGFAGGWPSIFYVLGAVGVVWAAIWIYAVADAPKKHARISDNERRYIVESLADSTMNEKLKVTTEQKTRMQSIF